MDIQKSIEHLMVNGYLAAINLAESEDVNAEQFKSVARQTLLGIFLSINEVAMDHLTPEERIMDLEKNLKEFTDAAMTAFDQALIEEENKERASSALRLMDKNPLTEKGGAGEIGTRFEKGDSNE